jgi:hypothetical protein
MFGPFLRIAVNSPGRRKALATAVAIHLFLFAAVSTRLFTTAHRDAVVLPLGMTLLLAGIVEGALLIGWRLTQIPRSQALEFLLVSPVPPWKIYVAEAAVGLFRLAIVTLSGVPILALLAALGRLLWVDVVVFVVMPFTWGAVTGLGLTTWAYETLGVRRWGERIIAAGVLLYLVVGVLAGENLPHWLAALPPIVADYLLIGFYGFHANNPFGVMNDWCLPHPWTVLPRMIGLELLALGLIVIFLARSAARLKGHFRDRHYAAKRERGRAAPGALGERPLSWWAVKRVMEYAGRVNLYLAGGFGTLYAAYILSGDRWPAWLGRRAFEIVDLGMAGVAGFTTGLVVLSAVPAAFQYGLWDSSAQERCKRMELLLTTELDSKDYFLAALAAAWRRGSGYLLVACIIWLAAIGGGRLNAVQTLYAAACSGVLLLFYFAVGYWSFVRGIQANGLGSLLTLAAPGLVLAFTLLGVSPLNWLLPPGAVYASQAQPLTPLAGLYLLGYTLFAFWLYRRSLARGDAWLRRWFDLNHGKKADAAT